MSTNPWSKHRYKPVAAEPRPEGSWWQRHALGEAERHEFYVDAKKLEPVLSQTRFGQMSYRPTLGPDSVTTVQEKRWREKPL